MSGKTDVLLYTQYGQIELTGDTIDSFQSLLKTFVDGLRNRTLKGPIRIALAELADLPKTQDGGYDLRRVDLRDSQLRVILRSPVPAKHAELRFDENLNLLTAKLRQAASD
jgi:hypothetical protein